MITGDRVYISGHGPYSEETGTILGFGPEGECIIFLDNQITYQSTMVTVPTTTVTVPMNEVIKLEDTE
jgi:hypothetical protein